MSEVSILAASFCMGFHRYFLRVILESVILQGSIIHYHHKECSESQKTFGISRHIFLATNLAIPGGISYNSSRGSATLSLFCGAYCNLLNNLFTSLLWI